MTDVGLLEERIDDDVEDRLLEVEILGETLDDEVVELLDKLLDGDVDIELLDDDDEDEDVEDAGFVSM